MGSERGSDYRLEALKLLKEWSTALVVVQTGAMAVLGGLIKDSKMMSVKPWISISLGCFLASILITANVIGAIPGMVQQLSESTKNNRDIYQMRNYFGIPLWIFALCQHLFFAAGLVAFGGFVYFGITQ